MNSFWKLLGLILSVIASFFSSAMSDGYSWGGCNSTIECLVVPKAAWLLSIMSAIFLLICIYALFHDIQKIKRLTISYIIIVAILAITIFLFRDGGVLHNLIHGTNYECSLLSDYKRDICFSKLAKDKNDIKICNEISQSMWENDCTSFFAEQSGDPNTCGASDISCLYKVARATKDPKVCEQISNQGVARSNCYNLIAQETGDNSICERVDNNSPSKCNIDSLIYPATKVSIVTTNNQLAFNSGTNSVKISDMKISTVGGDGALGGLSIIDQSDKKVQNLKIVANGSTLTPIRSTKISNQSFPNATQYDFDFGKNYLLIKGSSQTTLNILADIPVNAAGGNLYITMGGVSYPSGLNFQIEGIGSLVSNVSIR